MIFLLNYLVYIVAALGLYLTYKWRKNVKRAIGTVIATILAVLVLNAVQPGYVPAGSVPSTIPYAIEEQRELPVNDNLRKPDTEQIEADRVKAYDWKQKVEENKSE